jgi:hypothetical protein
MTTITDNFGIWNNLGTITPVISAWTKFPNMATGGLDIIRASFIYNESLDINSYIWLRSRFVAENNEVVTQSRKVYPTMDYVILELLIPSEFKQRGNYFRYFELKKVIYGNRYIAPDQKWRIKLEELWG